ncbi:hypothetical protein [Desulfosporosinus sp. Sb-LF]|uniref:hypothetical protein n=1 Tax=Desulfosporosinus sp. Sb-LF TaxID=2560027 RepID=UPI00107F4158|nr:hypothetical protein [Desulfosporosinus sp. Sb-LF]TGE33487.1 hypothetical protein E4K68_04880 [Desulfosporosinus sp. Sb-LF]
MKDKKDKKVKGSTKNTRNKIFKPINMFKLVIVVAVVILSSFVLFGSTTGLQKIQLNLANQMLLSILLTANGIQGLKNSHKQKRVMAYSSLVVAVFILGLTIITLLQISNFS